MLSSDTRTIDDLEVTTQKLPARRAFALQNKILKLVGPALGALTDGAAAGAMAQMDVAALAAALAKLVGGLEDGAAERLLLDILGATAIRLTDPVRMVTIDKPAAIDEVFTGRLMTMYKVAAFALEWNFRDFFDAASAALARQKSAADAAKVTTEKSST